MVNSGWACDGGRNPSATRTARITICVNSARWHRCAYEKPRRAEAGRGGVWGLPMRSAPQCYADLRPTPALGRLPRKAPSVVDDPKWCPVEPPRRIGHVVVLVLAAPQGADQDIAFEPEVGRREHRLRHDL